MKTATFVRACPGFRGDARLYRLSEPMEWEDYEGKRECECVIVSGVDAFGCGLETYIFPAREDSDEPLSWAELPGSFRGGIDHAEALRAAGYEVSDAT